MNLPDLSQIDIITPAIAISVLAYMVNFFGKVIADQKPFSDDRKWEIQIGGSIFILNVILSGTAGVYLANTFPLGVGHWWLHAVTFFVLSFLGGCLLFYSMQLGNNVYDIRRKAFEKFNEKLFGIPLQYAPYGKYVTISLLPIVIFYFLTLELISENIYWTIITFALGFNMLVWSALGYSLRTIEGLAPTTIYFKDGREPIIPSRILKINEDNIRLRVEDTIVIINKDEVLKIEMKIPDKLL